MYNGFTLILRQIQLEATWFSACGQLTMSGGGILQHQRRWNDMLFASVVSRKISQLIGIGLLLLLYPLVGHLTNVYLTIYT